MSKKEFIGLIREATKYGELLHRFQKVVSRRLEAEVAECRCFFEYCSIREEMNFALLDMLCASKDDLKEKTRIYNKKSLGYLKRRVDCMKKLERLVGESTDINNEITDLMEENKKIENNRMYLLKAFLPSGSYVDIG